MMHGFESISRYETTIVGTASSFISEVAPPLIAGDLHAVLANYGTVRQRLFPFAVAELCQVSEQKALVTAAASHMWWAAAEFIDDFVDEDSSSEMTTRPPVIRAISAAALGLIALPTMLLLKSGSFDGHERVKILDEFTRGHALVAEGEIKDTLLGDDPSASIVDVLNSYRGKTGVPYGRDAAMIASSQSTHGSESPEENVAIWREFGNYYGILRQLANDAAGLNLDNESDLAVGTMTALTSCGRSAFTGKTTQFDLLRTRARTSLSAREELFLLLTDDHAIGLEYGRVVSALHAHTCKILDTVSGGGLPSAVLRAEVDFSAADALSVTAATKHDPTDRNSRR